MIYPEHWFWQVPHWGSPRSPPAASSYVPRSAGTRSGTWFLPHAGERKKYYGWVYRQLTRIQKWNYSLCIHRNQRHVHFQVTTLLVVSSCVPERCAAGRQPAPSRSRPSSCCSLIGCSPAACSVSPWFSLLTSSCWCTGGPLWTPRQSCRCHPHVAGRAEEESWSRTATSRKKKLTFCYINNIVTTSCEKEHLVLLPLPWCHCFQRRCRSQQGLWAVKTSSLWPSSSGGWTSPSASGVQSPERTGWTAGTESIRS